MLNGFINKIILLVKILIIRLYGRIKYPMIRKKVKVLLIEDNPVDSKIIKGHLLDSNQINYDIHSVISLKAAKKFVADSDIDVILLDLSLPDSTDYNTYREIKSQAHLTPIVVVTSNDSEKLASRIFKNGAQDYLLKQSLNKYILNRAIGNAIRRYQMQNQLESYQKKNLEQERIFKKIIFDSSDGIIIIDKKNKVKFINKAGAKLLNKTKSELMGQILMLPYKINKNIPLTIVTKNNGLLSISVETQPIEWKNEDNYLLTLRNTNDLENRFKVLFENSYDLIHIMDKNEQTLWANPMWKKIFGYPLRTHRLPWTKVYKDDQAEYKKKWELFISGKESFQNVVYRYKTIRNKYIYLKTTIKEVKNNSMTYFYVISKDISDEMIKGNIPHNI